jgi:hypothetical protein
MEKKFYFLFGPPRSGNTLLGSILNQNKEIAVTANSIVPHITEYLNFLKTDSTYKNFPDESSLNNVLYNVRNNYYMNWKQKYIIERCSLVNSISFNYCKQLYKDNFKSIILVRPLFDIIKSFMYWCKNNKTFLHNSKFKNDDELINTLLSFDSKTFLEIRTIKLIAHHTSNLIIEYDDLVNCTKECINKIYNHLNIPSFMHNLNTIEPFQVNGLSYHDEVFGENLHSVRNKICKNNIEIKLPQSIINSYKEFNIYWK